MFGKKGEAFLTEEGGEERLQDTIIAEGVKVEGDFKSRGNIIIEGAVDGSIKTNNNLQVGERAKISANVEATNAYVAGEISGNVSVKEKLELAPTAKIFGDLEAKTLIINAGALFNGKCQMADANAPVAARTDKKLKKEQENAESAAQ